MCNPRRRPRKNPACSVAALAVMLGWWIAPAGLARADGKDVEDGVAKATEAFSDASWDAAKKAAEEAEAAAKKAGLADDKVMARVYVVLGAIQAAGFHNPGKAVESFRRALKIDAGVKLTKAIAKPEVIKAFKSALIMNRTEAASAAATSDADSAKVDTKAEEKKVEAKAAEDAKAEEKKAEEKKAEEKTEAKIDAKVVKAAKNDEDEEEDEDVSLDELRRRARAAKESKETKAPDGDGKSSDGKTDGKPAPKDVSGTETEVVKKIVKKKPAKPKNTEPEEPDLPATIAQPLHCPNPDDAPPHQIAVLRCVTQPGLAAARVLLYYRLPGSEEFVSTIASKTKRGWYVATVPAEAFVGKFMQYYFEARSGSDKTVASNGKWDSPNLMLIRQGAPVVGAGALAGMRMAGEAVVLTEEDPLAAPITSAPGRNRMWVALSVGTGFGYSGNSDLEWYTLSNGVDPRSVPGGFRSAGPLVIAPAFGYHLNDTWAVSIETRHQFILREGADNTMPGAPAVGAHSILVKGIYMRPMFARTTLVLSGAVGALEGVRLVVPPDAMAPEPRTSSDSIRSGPVLVGVGAAVDVRIARKLSLRVTLPQILLGLPTNTAVVFDIGAGLVYEL